MFKILPFILAIAVGVSSVTPAYACLFKNHNNQVVSVHKQVRKYGGRGNGGGNHQSVTVNVQQNQGGRGGGHGGGGNWGRGGHGGWNRGGWSGGGGWGGFGGGIVGGIIGGTIADILRPAPPVIVVAPELQPWTPEWFTYCGQKFQSFDPHSGYYMGYNGQRYFCQ